MTSQLGLRDVAAHLDLPPGFKVEVLAGSIVMSPTPSKKHGAVLRRLYDQISPQLPEGRVAEQRYSVGALADEAIAGEDYASPDLLITAIEVEDEEGWLVSPEAVDAVVEVVSPSNHATDLKVKPALYAHWGIPIYLIVDPRHASLRLYWDPHDGEYRAHHDTHFGEEIVLPEPLKDIRLATDTLPRYATAL